MSINVSISETYDLRTQVGKMTLIGVHTPKRQIIQKMYPGLCMNCRFVRIKSMDVVLTAVSQLPVSPDQLGTDSTAIAPQDMLNPILYKAVSNESMSALEARLAGMLGADEILDMATYTPGHVTDSADEFRMYYALLAEHDGFKIAHPQQGLSMKHLVPLVFEKYYNYGVNGASEDKVPQYSGSTLSLTQKTVQGMRGKAHPMPRFNTSYITASPTASGSSTDTIQKNGMSDGTPENSQTLMPNILPVYCGMILLPPSVRTLMYYRMRITVHLEFSDVRPMQEVVNFNGLNHLGSSTYHSDYDSQSKMLSTAQETMVDTANGTLEKIMEGR